jgi:hypothetical protein
VLQKLANRTHTLVEADAGPQVDLRIQGEGRGEVDHAHSAHELAGGCRADDTLESVRQKLDASNASLARAVRRRIGPVRDISSRAMWMSTSAHTSTIESEFKN